MYICTYLIFPCPSRQYYDIAQVGSVYCLFDIKVAECFVEAALYVKFSLRDLDLALNHVLSNITKAHN